ncbi:unnamed protein product, partial [Tenebrio molitor]
KQNLLVQVYSLVVATVQVAASATSFIHHRRLVLANFKKIKLVMVVATFIFMNSFTICTVLAPTFLKRKQWRKLLQHLQDIERITVNRNTTKMSFLLEFVAVHAIILIPSIYYVYIWNEILSPNFFNQYFVELVQIYFQFFYIYLLCTVVKMLHSGYKYANTLVLKQLNYITLENHVSQKFFHLQMRQIEDIFCFLQEANVEFNDVFGWPIILIILNSAFFFLNYLSEIFRNNFSYGDNLYVEAVVSNMSLASVIMLGTIVFCLLCNSVLDEAKSTILLSYKLRQRLVSPEKSDISEFINLITNNFPNFSAAGFFSVNRSTIFNMLQPLYVYFTEIKLVVSVSMVIIVDILNCYTVLAPVFCKRRQYWSFMTKLHDYNQVSLGSCCERIPLYVRFLLPNATYWVVSLYAAYVWTDILGFAYYEEYFVEVIQLYFQFYYNYFLCIIVKIFLGKYKYVNSLLSEQLNYVKAARPISTERFLVSLERIENIVCFLKELNLIFNDLCGWPIMLIILYSSLLNLNYLDDIFKNSFGYDQRQFIGVIISNISVVLITNTGTVSLILLCDSVLEEAKVTVLLSYKLRQYTLPKEKQEMSDFVKVLLDNFPEFTAAGFFSITKTTIFHMISTVTTFFIIIIQFNTNSANQ